MTFKNNPFNIRKTDSQWLGLSGSRRGFCEFTHVVYGVRVAIYLLKKTYRNRGIVSLEDIISTFAPPSENNTQVYIDYVCANSGLTRTSVVEDKDLYAVLSSMAYMESHYILPFNLYKRAYELV